jgi:hypothetical protein
MDAAAVIRIVITPPLLFVVPRTPFSPSYDKVSELAGADLQKVTSRESRVEPLVACPTARDMLGTVLETRRKECLTT